MPRFNQWRRLPAGHQQQPAHGFDQLVDGDLGGCRQHHWCSRGNARSDQSCGHQRLEQRLQLVPYAKRRLDHRRRAGQGMGAGRLPHQLHLFESTGDEWQHGALQRLSYERQARRRIRFVRSHGVLRYPGDPGLQRLSLLAGNRHAGGPKLARSFSGSRDRDLDELGIRKPDYEYRELRASAIEHVYQLRTMPRGLQLRGPHRL